MSNIIKAGSFNRIEANENLGVFSISEIDTTDVSLSSKAILNPFGLDPICKEISLEKLPYITANEMTIKLSLTTDRDWDGKDTFVKAMNKTNGAAVLHEPHPYKPKHTKIFFIGTSGEIMQLGEILREKFASDQLEGNTVIRAIAHPEQIGEVLDALSKIISKKENTVSPETAFSYGAYSHDWQP